MEFVKITSKTIDSVGYVGTTLFVKFNNGGVYIYEDVPEQVYKTLLVSESKGHFLNESVKPYYKFTKLI